LGFATWPIISGDKKRIPQSQRERVPQLFKNGRSDITIASKNLGGKEKKNTYGFCGARRSSWRNVTLSKKRP